jgi:hypothetical protein
MSTSVLPPPASQVADYLDRLRDMLPPREVRGVLAEVTALIEDRLESESEGPPTPEGTRAALRALGSPEALAASLAGDGSTIDLATRRAFTRMLAVVFAGHLLLAIILTVIGRGSTLVPGLVTALPREGLLATLCGVAGVFLSDVGLLGVVFALFGRRRAPEILLRLPLRMPVRRRDTLASLVLLVLVALLVNLPAFRDALFAVGGDAGRTPILAPDVLELIPVVDAVLFLFALRFVLQLASGTERVASVAADGLASLAGAVFCVLLMTRNELVQLPVTEGLGQHAVTLFAGLISRVVLVVSFVTSLLLVTRFVKRCLRIRQLVATA